METRPGEASKHLQGQTPQRKRGRAGSYLYQVIETRLFVNGRSLTRELESGGAGGGGGTP